MIWGFESNFGIGLGKGKRYGKGGEGGERDGTGTNTRRVVFASSTPLAFERVV